MVKKNVKIIQDSTIENHHELIVNEKNVFITVIQNGKKVGRLHIMSDGSFYVSNIIEITIVQNSSVGERLALVTGDEQTSDYLHYEKVENKI